MFDVRPEQLSAIFGADIRLIDCDVETYGASLNYTLGTDIAYIDVGNSAEVIRRSAKSLVGIQYGDSGIPLLGKQMSININQLGILYEGLASKPGRIIVLGDYSDYSQDTILGNENVETSELKRAVQRYFPGRLNELNNQIVANSDVNLYQITSGLFDYFIEQPQSSISTVADFIQNVGEQIRTELMAMLDIKPAEAEHLITHMLNLKLRNLKPEAEESATNFLERQYQTCLDYGMPHNILYPAEIAEKFSTDQLKLKSEYNSSQQHKFGWGDLMNATIQRRYYDAQVPLFDQQGLSLEDYLVQVCTSYETHELMALDFPTMHEVAAHFGCHKRRVEVAVRKNAVIQNIFSEVREQKRIKAGIKAGETLRKANFEFKGICYASADEALVSELFTRYLGYTAVEGATYQVSPQEIAQDQSDALSQHKFDYLLNVDGKNVAIEYRDVHWLALNAELDEKDPEFIEKLEVAKMDYLIRRRKLLDGIDNIDCVCLFSVNEVISYIESIIGDSIIKPEDVTRFVRFWGNLTTKTEEQGTDLRTKLGVLYNRLQEFFSVKNIALEV